MPRGGDTTALKSGGIFSDSTAFIFLLAKFDKNFPFNIFTMSKKISKWEGGETPASIFLDRYTDTNIVKFSLFCLAFFFSGGGCEDALIIIFFAPSATPQTEFRK